MKFSYLFYEPISSLSELSSRMLQIGELGYAGVELTATHPLGYDVRELQSVIEQTRMPVVSLLSGWSYANEGLCLASADSRVRDRAVERLVEYVDVASQIGSIVVIGLMQGLRSDEKDTNLANDRIAAALSRVARAAESRRVTIVIEPVNHLQVGFNHTAGEVATLVDRVGSSAVTLMLDTIHMNIEERSPLDTIREYGTRIGHFHLCESNGGVFGSGNLDFASVFAALDEVQYDKFVSIKVYRHVGWLEAARSTMSYLRQVNLG
jgi:sugar phosphate isomerase/epimerase